MTRLSKRLSKQWVNAERTMMVTLWEDGTMEVATRETPNHVWGPPVYLEREL